MGARNHGHDMYSNNGFSKNQSQIIQSSLLPKHLSKDSAGVIGSIDIGSDANMSQSMMAQSEDSKSADQNASSEASNKTGNDIKLSE